MGGSYVTAKRKKPKLTKKYREMCELYSQFSKEWSHICEYGEERMMEMFLYETYGEGNIDNTNGYYLGQKWMGVAITMWREDIQKGLLAKIELYNDPNLPDWWLDKVLAGVPVMWENYDFANDKGP